MNKKQVQFQGNFSEIRFPLLTPESLKPVADNKGFTETDTVIFQYFSEICIGLVSTAVEIRSLISIPIRSRGRTSAWNFLPFGPFYWYRYFLLLKDSCAWNFSIFLLITIFCSKVMVFCPVTKIFTTVFLKEIGRGVL